MTDQQIAAWRYVASDLGVEIVAPCQITLNGGQILTATALVRVGPQKGMVVDPEWHVLEPYSAALLDEGYGFSAITLDEVYDRSGMVDVLKDWGWKDET